MPSADVWAATFPTAYTDHDAGYDIARLIALKSSTITVIRAGAAQSAQVVRIEENRSDRVITTDAGRQHRVDAIVFGYKGHATVTDTDLQPGDRFKDGGLAYEILAIVPELVDSLQAYARVIS